MINWNEFKFSENIDFYSRISPNRTCMIYILRIMFIRLILGSPQGELSADPNTLPCILQSLEKDGTIRKGPPGYQVSVFL